MRDVVSPSLRRILCVFPRYSPSFGTFEYAYPLTDGVQAIKICQFLEDVYQILFVQKRKLLMQEIIQFYWDELSS